MTAVNCPLPPDDLRVTTDPTALVSLLSIASGIPFAEIYAGEFLAADPPKEDPQGTERGLTGSS